MLGTKPVTLHEDQNRDAEMLAHNIRTVFQQARKRSTCPQKLIAELLVAQALEQKDFSIDDLWHQLRQQDARLGRSTLYRLIEILVHEGLLDRIDFADGTHRYHVCANKSHQHLTCVHCRRFVEVSLTLPVEQFVNAGVQADFALEGFTLTLFGRCSDCRSQ
jgi:Fur family transcriptional regulator, ferric uptake regulator